MALVDDLLASLSLDYAGPPVVEPGDTIRVEVVDALADLALVPTGPVPLEFSWSLSRVDGTTRETLQPGVDYVAPVSAGRVLNVVVKPPIHELPSFGGGALPAQRIVIHAQVRVRGLASAPWVPLPELPLDLEPIGLPTVLLSFVHTSFRLPVLVCVPFESGLRSVSQLLGIVNQLSQVASKLRGLAGFAAWLAGLDMIAGALEDLPRSEVVFTARGDITDLNNFDMIKRGHPLADDTEAEDEFMSCILLGPRWASATYWVDRGFSGGSLTLTVGALPFVLMPSLVPDNPRVWPAETPDPSDPTKQIPAVQFNPTTTSPEWENAFSSLKVSAPMTIL